MTTHDRLPILLAVGDSDAHDAALRFAAEEAVHQHRPLHLVHVMHPASGVTVPEQMLVSFEAATLVAQELLTGQAERAADLVHGQVEIIKHLRRGSVVDELVGLSVGADHIVLQHRQQARLLRVFTGSVCAGVAGRALVPVISVPELWSASTSKHQVLVGLDGVEGNNSLLEQAFREAAARNALLTVLHAWFVPSMYDDAIVDRVALHQWREAVRKQIDEVLQPFTKAHPSVEVRIELPHMRPADALVEESGHSDLLLVGRRRAAHGLAHLGPVARAVIRETRCPVVVVAPDGVSVDVVDVDPAEERVMS